MEELRNILGLNTEQPFDFVAWEHKKVEDYNASTGDLNEKDGYDCPTCKNRGDMMIIETKDGWPRPRVVDCKCKAMRYTIARMKRSGHNIQYHDTSSPFVFLTMLHLTILRQTHLLPLEFL